MERIKNTYWYVPGNIMCVTHSWLNLVVKRYMKTDEGGKQLKVDNVCLMKKRIAYSIFSYWMKVMCHFIHVSGVATAQVISNIL